MEMKDKDKEKEETTEEIVEDITIEDILKLFED